MDDNDEPDAEHPWFVNASEISSTEGNAGDDTPEREIKSVPIDFSCI